MDLVRTVAPAALFSDLVLIKKHLRLDNTASDVILAHYAAVAEQYLDGRAGRLQRALLTQAWRLTLEDWPAYECQELPLPPLQSISSITYYDTSNVLQTLAADQYVVVTGDFVGRVERAPLGIWPSVYGRRDAVQITFVAGYGAALANLPTPITQGALLAIGNMFANRGDDAGMAFSPTALALLDPYRVAEFK